MGSITTIKREIVINQSKESVWKALADFGNICHGHPAVNKSYITSAQKQGVGATRHCDESRPSHQRYGTEYSAHWHHGLYDEKRTF